MTNRSPALLACALLACAAAQAAPKKKPPAAPTQETAAANAAPQDIDVDALARAKDGKPTEPLQQPEPAAAPAESTGTGAQAPAPADDAAEKDATAPAGSAETDAQAETAKPQDADASASTQPTKPVDEAAEPATAAPPMERPSPLAPPPAPTAIDKSIAAACEARATSLLDAAQKGDYDGATHDFDAKMRTALPPAKFRQAWESLAQFGALQARGQAHPMMGDGYIAITIPLIFEKKNLYAQVACGSDGRVAGFYVKPL